MCATGSPSPNRSSTPQAAGSVTSAETANGWTLTLTCRHGVTSVDIIRDGEAEIDPFAFLFADAILRSQHEAAEGCGCAERAVPAVPA